MPHEDTRKKLLEIRDDEDQAMMNLATKLSGMTAEDFYILIKMHFMQQRLIKEINTPKSPLYKKLKALCPYVLDSLIEQSINISSGTGQRVFQKMREANLSLTDDQIIELLAMSHIQEVLSNYISGKTQEYPLKKK